MDRKLKLDQLNWRNSFVGELPADARTDNLLRIVRKACYSRFSLCAEVDNPVLVLWSESVADLIDLDHDEFARLDFPMIFAGALTLDGSIPHVQCYAGNQFMLDGQSSNSEATSLGDILNSRSKRWELQLQGAGKTPYTYSDGLAVLGNSIKEFLCSEALHYLNIPTTRALCLVRTGKYVTRTNYNDMSKRKEPCAVLCRVAQSFLRFGSYEIHSVRSDNDVVGTLADYCIRHHFPHLENLSRRDRYAAWVVEIAERTASLIASWMGIGFTHGWLISDKMSVLGLTMDFGVFGFMDSFDLNYSPSTTELETSFTKCFYFNQHKIGKENIAQFAGVLSIAKLINEKEATYAVERYETKYKDEYQALFSKKLGLEKCSEHLIDELLKNLALDHVDFTNFFRLLSNISYDPCVREEELLIPLKAVLLDINKERRDAWTIWLKSYIGEISASAISGEERRNLMKSVNPKYILRNCLCESAIHAAESGDFEEVRSLLRVLQRPYDEQPGMERYASLPPSPA